MEGWDAHDSWSTRIVADTRIGKAVEEWALARGMQYEDVPSVTLAARDDGGYVLVLETACVVDVSLLRTLGAQIVEHYPEVRTVIALPALSIPDVLGSS
jgi:hypothetical protein